MADIKTQLEEQLKLLEEVAQKKEKLKTLNEQQQRQVLAMANLLNGDLQKMKQIVATQRELLNAKKKSGDENSRAGIELQKHVALLDFVIKKRAEEGRKIEKIGKSVAAINPKLAKQSEHVSNITDSLHRGVDAMDLMSMGTAAATERITAMANEAKSNFTGQQGFAPFEKDAQKFVGGLVTMVGKVGGALAPVASVLAREAGGAMKEMANRGMAAIANMVDQLDTSFRGMVKSTGFYSEDLHNIFINNLTGRADNVSEMVDETGKKLRMLDDIYIDPTDSVDAMQSLRSSTAAFHEEIKAGRTGIANYMANMVAGFKKLGVSTDSSAKAINMATKALNKSPAASVEFMKRIKAVGQSIGQNINETFSQMTSAAPQITMFGDRVVDVFGKVAAQAKAAGMETNDLLNTAMKFDTFEGAAEAAGKLNAVLGETAIDVMELVHADPDEKINIIRNAVEGTIGGFDQLDRRTKQVIAGIVSGGDTMKAAQMLGNKDAFSAYADNLSTQAETNDQLMKQMREAGDIDDILKGAASNAAGLIKNVTALKRTGAKVVYGTGAVVTGAINGIADAVDMGIGAVKNIGGAVKDGISGVLGAAFKGPQGFGDTAPVQGFSDTAAKSLDNVHKKIAVMKKDAGQFHLALAGAGGGPDAIKGLKGAVQGFSDAFSGLEKVGSGKVEESLKTLPGAIETFSAALEKNSDKGLAKFNAGLTQMATSAAALQESLTSLGTGDNFESLNKHMSDVFLTEGSFFDLESMIAAAADNPAMNAINEAVASGKLNTMEFMHADEAGRTKMLADLGLEKPEFEAMDRRTKTVIEEVVGPMGGGFDTLRPQGPGTEIEPLMAKLDTLVAKLDSVAKIMLEGGEKAPSLDVKMKILDREIKPVIENVVRTMK